MKKIPEAPGSLFFQLCPFFTFRVWPWRNPLVTWAVNFCRWPPWGFGNPGNMFWRMKLWEGLVQWYNWNTCSIRWFNGIFAVTCLYINMWYNWYNEYVGFMCLYIYFGENMFGSHFPRYVVRCDGYHVYIWYTPEVPSPKLTAKNPKTCNFQVRNPRDSSKRPYFQGRERC